MKILKSLTVLTPILLLLCSVAHAQQTGGSAPGLLPGSVYGDIVIKEVSGNHIGNFSCSNLTVYVSKLSENGWKRKATATGNFSARRCSFRVANVPAGETFIASVKAEFPNGCDEKKFETTTSFPMRLKGREQLRYGFAVMRIRCVLVK